MPRTPGSKNKRTMAALVEYQQAHRRLVKLFGKEWQETGIAPTPLDVLLDLTRATHDPGTRLQAAKELSAILYPRPKPVAIDAVTREPLDESVAETEGESVQIELAWGPREDYAA